MRRAAAAGVMADEPLPARPPSPAASLGDASEIVAWKFDPACVLQSDIVGFTALGSRISAEELCRCDECPLTWVDFLSTSDSDWARSILA